jgi:hypothetical protein
VSLYVDYIIACTTILKLVILNYHMDLDCRIAISLYFVLVCTRRTFIIPYCCHHPTNPSRCVVGEAHKHSSMYIYSCHDCNSFGCKFMLYFTLNCRGKLELNKQKFVRHWNEEHCSVQYPTIE